MIHPYLVVYVLFPYSFYWTGKAFHLCTKLFKRFKRLNNKPELYSGQRWVSISQVVERYSHTGPEPQPNHCIVCQVVDKLTLLTQFDTLCFVFLGHACDGYLCRVKTNQNCDRTAPKCPHPNVCSQRYVDRYQTSTVFKCPFPNLCSRW